MKARLARVAEIFHPERENGVLGTLYIAVLVFLLAAYLFVAVRREAGYNPGLYRNVYVYFMVFDFILFSLFIPFWETGESTPQKARPLKTAAGIAVLAASPAPLILAVFMAGRISPVNFLLPLALKAVWGSAVVGLRNFLGAVKPGWRWNGFLTGFFIFSVLALSGLLAFFHVEYRQAVITTLYDRDIPGVFFLNPLLSLAGLVYCQAGGGSQAGLFPLYACALFWGSAAAVLLLAAGKIPGGGAGRG
ncbi:MAG: hypothetical protein K6U04_09155 [Armatimonadetes bacterium]|nr:hypothetical protein [Armatimonadota bacterium]